MLYSYSYYIHIHIHISNFVATKEELVGCKPNSESLNIFKVRDSETEKNPLLASQTMTEKSKSENPNVSDARQFQTRKLQSVKKQKEVSQSASDGKFQMSLNIVFL